MLVAVVAAGAPSAVAQDASGRAWAERKCDLYAAAWSAALGIQGPQGLRRDFLDRHDAFLGSGCRAPSSVCPITAEELELANLLSLMAVSEGMTGSFLPFACQD